MNNRLLQDKVIVIVGGTTGLGFSAAQACATAGARLIIVGRDAENAAVAENRLGTAAEALVGDACQSNTASQAIEMAIEKFGRFDGLYHVAGGSGRSQGDGPLDQISDQGWDYTLQLNLTSLFYSNRAAVQQFLRQKRAGSVLNMGSVLGFSPSVKHFSTHTYATTKAAVVGLTKASAAYYAKNRIRFNIVAPALVDTPLAQRAVSDVEIMEYIATKQPLDGGRIGRPEDLDAAVVYFLSDQSRFVTGQVLEIDGGWTITEGQYYE